jgi:HAE1 family hydrophobic/amphiphilic exporter-1
MNLSEPFIRRPVMTILGMISILLFGVICYKNLPVSDLPSVDMPTIQVSVSFPGASPETMSNSVTTPLEDEFMTINGIETLFSSSSTGSSTIVLQFSLDRDIDDASTDVQAAISRAQPQLPSNIPNQPTYEKVNPAQTPILYYAVSSKNMTLGELYDYGSTFIGNRLSMVEGVAQVMTYGYPYAVRIQVDPEKLAAKNIGLDQFTEQVRNTNVDLPLGTLYGQVLNAPGYSQLVIKNQKGDLVKVKDIGKALDSTQNDKFFQHYISKEGNDPCIVLGVRRLPGKNSVQITKMIEAKIEELKQQLPPSLKIIQIYKAADAIIEGVTDVKLTLIVAFFIVVSVIYLSHGKGLNTIIPSLSLPLAIFGTFAVMYLLGFSLDVLSLLALTLCIGFLVDDAIVVLENIVRHVQEGSSAFEAAIKGSKQISITVFSMTLCLTAAFIPMLFLGGVVCHYHCDCGFAFGFCIANFNSHDGSKACSTLLGGKQIAHGAFCRRG